MDITPSRTARRRGRRLAAVTLPLALLAGSAGASVALTGVGSHGRTSNWASGGWLGSSASGVSTTLADVRAIIGANTGPAAALTGAGVGVALIDTGVAAVPGLPAAQIVNGPDLSIESQSASLRYLDTYGHGTHMAGIILGNDTATGTKGIAPGVKLTSIKVGTSNGAVDVSQMIAAVDWVVAHKNDDSTNPIRVVNLSYGTGGTPPFWTDPVQLAVERAWMAGIVVVAAAGNNGSSTNQLSDPASDQFNIAVGADATNGTLSISDDSVTAFTNVVTSGKHIDLLAPGESIVSLRDPGSSIDNSYSAARVGTTLFRGSGTSQAAAVTSAAVALLLQAKPSMTPDQVKFATKQGTWVPNGIAASQGLNVINVNRALSLPLSTETQNFGLSAGTGKLEDARGPSHIVSNGVALTGENSIFGPFDSAAWAAKSGTHTTWVGGTWMGYRFAGDGWTGTSWASKTWAAATWAGAPWGGATSWVDPNWTSRFWSGRFWSAGVWTSRFWSSDDWSTAYWG